MDVCPAFSRDRRTPPTHPWARGSTVGLSWGMSGALGSPRSQLPFEKTDTAWGGEPYFGTEIKFGVSRLDAACPLVVVIFWIHLARRTVKPVAALENSKCGSDDRSSECVVVDPGECPANQSRRVRQSAFPILHDLTSSVCKPL